MRVKPEQLVAISGGSATAQNVRSVVAALDSYGGKFGLHQPHRLAHFLAQLAHESAGFKYDKEIASGSAYEGRKDLGNTQAGDGKRYKGRGPIQITGRSNYREFTKWVRKIIPDAPNFETDPEKINTDPYEGLGPIWYWDTRNLNRLADRNDIENISAKINGRNRKTGQPNGMPDRLRFYDRAALVLMGYQPTSLKAFQIEAKKHEWYTGEVDGLSGPLSRAALHRGLMAMSDKADLSSDVQAAPVVEEKKVVPKKVEKEVKERTNVLQWIMGAAGIGGTGASAVFGSNWQTIAAVGGVAIALLIVVIIFRRYLIEAIKEIRGDIEE